MYQVKCDNNYIYDPRIKELKIISPQLSVELNKTGSFNFIIPPQNPYYNLINKLKSIITIYQDGEEIWRGRVLNDSMDFYKRKQVECEGELSFLLDTIQRPYAYTGDIRPLFEKFIANHNVQVEEVKKFEIGEITVTDPNNYINREDSHYTKTWDCINGKLIETHGGYLRTRKEDGKRHIDYVTDYGRINNQVIQFGKNLLDITQYIKGEDVITALIPLGKDKLDIKSANDGKDYVYSEEAVALFGWIWGTNEWEDVTIPTNLLRKAEEYLDNAINLAITLEISAVDLHYLDVNIEAIRLGDKIRVVSIPHGLDKYFLASKLAINLTDIKSSKLVLGHNFSTLTEKQANQEKGIKGTINSVILEKDNIKKEISETKEKVIAMDEVVTGIQSDYVIKEELEGRCLLKGEVKNLNELKEIENTETGDIYKVLSNN